MAQSWQMIEVVGSSRESIQAAVRQAIGTAKVRDAKWFEVREIRGSIQGRDIEFQVRVAIGYEGA
jgi:flavin-binding protein dodecin